MFPPFSPSLSFPQTSAFLQFAKELKPAVLWSPTAPLSLQLFRNSVLHVLLVLLQAFLAFEPAAERKQGLGTSLHSRPLMCVPLLRRYGSQVIRAG